MRSAAETDITCSCRIGRLNSPADGGPPSDGSVREYFDRALSAVLKQKRGKQSAESVEKAKQLLESMAVVKWGCEHALPNPCARPAWGLAPFVFNPTQLNSTALWWRSVADCSPLEERSRKVKR